MPELKHTFTKGRMNKDLDERLVPNGEYRDALNIEVNTSEDSEVGAVQTTLGNTKLSNIFSEEEFRCIGAITDDKTDAAYWFIASYKTHSQQFYIDSLETDLTKPVIYKDVIAEFKNGNINPVIVDISKVVTYGSNLTGDRLRVTNINGISTAGIVDGISPGMKVEAVTVSGTSDLLDANGVEITTGVQVVSVDSQFNTVTISRDITINSNSSDPLAYLAFEHPKPALNFDVDNPITGINIIDDMLFWTDNYSEPKKINITRCKEGSREGFNKHTRFLTRLFYSPIGPELLSSTIDHGKTFSPNHTPDWSQYPTLTTVLSDPDGVPNSGDEVYPTILPWKVSTTLPNAIEGNYGQWGYYTGKYVDSNGNHLSLKVGSIYRLRINVLSPSKTGGSVRIAYAKGKPAVNPSSGHLYIPNKAGTHDLYWVLGDQPYGWQGNHLRLNKDDAWTGIIGDISVVEVSKGEETNSLTPIATSPGIMEEHITVIKESPLSPPALEMSQTKTRESIDITSNVGSIPDTVALIHYSNAWWGEANGIMGWHGNNLDRYETGAERKFIFTGLPVNSKAYNVGDAIIFENDPNDPEKTVRGEITSTYDPYKNYKWDTTQATISLDPASQYHNPSVQWENTNPKDKKDANGDFFSTLDLFDQDPTSPTYGQNLYRRYEVRISSIVGDVISTDRNWIVKLEQPSSLFEFKFPRFAYRYKYQDGEYSTFSPFSEVAFLPGRPGGSDFEYLPKKGYNLGMTNNLRYLAIKNFVAEDDLLPDGVIAIDLLYKESNSPSVYTIKTLNPGDLEWQTSIDGGHTKGYMEIKSEMIHAILPPNQILRPWDNVPRKALAQEMSGNRLIYGNYLQNYSVGAQDISFGFESKDLTDVKNDPEELLPEEAHNYLPAKSIKSLRTYQLGIIYKDKYGRETPVFSESKNDIADMQSKSSLYIEKLYAAGQTKLTAQLKTKPPSFAESFKFFIKETSNEYYNLALDRWYDAKDGNIWLSFPSSERNKVDIDTFLILKKEADNDVFVADTARYKILAIENEPPEYIKTKNVILGTIDDGYNDIATSSGIGFPKEEGNSLLVADGPWKEAGLDESTKGKTNLYVRLKTSTNSSLWYYINSIVYTTISGLYWEINVEGIFGVDMNITSTSDSHVSRKTDLKLEIKQQIIENKPEFDGRFFVKVFRDSVLDVKVAKRTDPSDVRYARVMERPIRYVNQYTSWAKGMDPQQTIQTSGKNWYGFGTDNTWDTKGGNRADKFWEGLAGFNSGYGDNGDHKRAWFVDKIHYYSCLEGKSWIKVTKHFHFPNKKKVTSYYSKITTGNINYDASVGRVYKPTKPGGGDEFAMDYNITNHAPVGINGHMMSLTLPGVGQKGASYKYAHQQDGKSKAGGSRMTMYYRGDDGANPAYAYFDEEVDFIEELTRKGTIWRFVEDPGGTMYITTKLHRSHSYWNYIDMIRPNPTGKNKDMLGWKDCITGRQMNNRRHRFTFSSEVFEFSPSGGAGGDIGSVGPYFYKPTNDPRFIYGEEDKYLDANGDEQNFTGFNPGGRSPGIRSDGMTKGERGSGIVWDGHATIEILRPVDEADVALTSTSPAIWETEPKEDVGLNIYHEVGQAYPVTLNAKTNEQYIPIGCSVTCYRRGTGWVPLDTGNGATIKVIACNDNTVTLEDALGVGLDGSMSDAPRPPSSSSYDILRFTRADGSNTEAWVVNVIGTVYVLNPDIWAQKITLPWFNCYSFGNGVESDRIRDDFNQVTIDNGPKVSTTLDEPYEEERRGSGLIYSGIYNSISGINSLNQFIQAEKITKDLNPMYGTIQKLHSRNTDLVTLCEDRVLKVLANKDAMYNADGNVNVTSNLNVLGQAVPLMGEHGISKNPESFASESYRAYFTDKYRGAVIRLSQDGLTPISEYGMKDYFSDNLKHYTSIIGSYDNKKSTYNVTLVNWEIDTSSKTVSFSEKSKGWTSFKSFIQEQGFSLNNEYYTFDKGELYKHHDNPIRNRFYGQDYDSSITVLFNEAPGSVKSFNTLNYEGSQSKITFDDDVRDPEYYNNVGKFGWYVDLMTTNLQTGSALEFKSKEDKWFSEVKGESTYWDGSGSAGNVDTKEFSVQGIGNASDIIHNIELVFGCMDPEATNYNPLANTDDGSCVYPPGASWNCECNPSTLFYSCIDPGDGSGTFADINVCRNSCVESYCGPDTYDCQVDAITRQYQCVLNNLGQGQYSSITDCQNSGCTGYGGPPSWDCVNSVCEDPGDGSGTYSSLTACQSTCFPTWNCITDKISGLSSCIDPNDSTGTYSSLASCQSSCSGEIGPIVGPIVGPYGCQNNLVYNADFQSGLDSVSRASINTNNIYTSEYVMGQSIPVDDWKGFHSDSPGSYATAAPNTNKQGLILTAGEPGATSNCGVYQIINGLEVGEAYQVEVKITKAPSTSAGSWLWVGNSWNNVWTSPPWNPSPLYVPQNWHKNIGGTAQSIPLTTGIKTWQFTAGGGPEPKVLVLDYQAINGEDITIERVCIKKL